jgi:hypothetical protein
MPNAERLTPNAQSLRPNALFFTSGLTISIQKMRYMSPKSVQRSALSVRLKMLYAFRLGLRLANKS